MYFAKCRYWIWDVDVVSLHRYLLQHPNLLVILLPLLVLHLQPALGHLRQCLEHCRLQQGTGAGTTQEQLRRGQHRHQPHQSFGRIFPVRAIKKVWSVSVHCNFSVTTCWPSLQGSTTSRGSGGSLLGVSCWLGSSSTAPCGKE